MLVISDVFNRNYIKELMNLILVIMKFGSCFLLQVKYKICYLINVFLISLIYTYSLEEIIIMSIKKNFILNRYDDY